MTDIEQGGMTWDRQAIEAHVQAVPERAEGLSVTLVAEQLDARKHRLWELMKDLSELNRPTGVRLLLVKAGIFFGSTGTAILPWPQETVLARIDGDTAEGVGFNGQDVCTMAWLSHGYSKTNQTWRTSVSVEARQLNPQYSTNIVSLEAISPATSYRPDSAKISLSTGMLGQGERAAMTDPAHVYWDWMNDCLAQTIAMQGIAPAASAIEAPAV